MTKTTSPIEFARPATDFEVMQQEHIEQLELELAEARTDADHWKSECSALMRMAHEMRAEIDYFQTLIDLQHKRTLEADKLWQQAHNQPNVWPDLGKLVEWLMNERKYALMERDDKRREVVALYEMIAEIRREL